MRIGRNIFSALYALQMGNKTIKKYLEHLSLLCKKSVDASRKLSWNRLALLRFFLLRNLIDKECKPANGRQRACFVML